MEIAEAGMSLAVASATVDRGTCLIAACLVVN